MKLKFGFLLTSIIILIFACSKDNGISLEPGENENNCYKWTFE